MVLRERQTKRAVLPQGRQWFWLGGAVLAGGVAGPVLLMLGLQNFPASEASLLLNSEGVLTALLAVAHSAGRLVPSQISGYFGAATL